MKYNIELEQANDGGWSGMIDDLPGLLLMGDTIDALLASAPEAISFYLEDSDKPVQANSFHPLSVAVEIAA
jgi:predicted RNase H-like HicB family nuclease